MSNIVKSVSLYRFTKFYGVKSVFPFRIKMLLQGQISLPFLIYNIFTGSNQSPFIDLQYFYRVKSASLYRFTMFLQGQISLPLSIYNIFTGSNHSSFFDLRYFYGANRSPSFRLTRFLQGQTIFLSSYSKFTW